MPNNIGNYRVVKVVVWEVSMKNTKQTSKGVASEAAEILSDPNSSKIQKTLAASALSQSNTNKQTSGELEHTASKVLKSPKYNDKTKSLAGTVLSQANKQRKK